MPKKQPRNAFYFYMLDFKEEQRKKGITYANMAEVANAAGPLWPAEPPTVRAKFEKLAKAEKAKIGGPQNKFTSTGVSLAELEAAQREARAAVEAERRDVLNFVKQKSINNRILDEDLYLMDVNSYCKTDPHWVVGELTLLRFSLRDGVKDTYHEVINPVDEIPLGYALDVKLGAKELGLPAPDEDGRRPDYLHVLATLVDYLRRGAAPRAPLPPLYTMPDKVAQCTDFIQQMCRKVAEDDSMFCVYQLDWLLFQLVSSLEGAGAGGDASFPKESLALAHLKRDVFKYSPGLACEMHEEVDKAVECTLARVKRWAFSVLDRTCGPAGVQPAPGRHVPPDYHLESILSYKETQRAAGGARAGGAGAGAGPPDSAPPSHDSSYASVLDASRGSSTTISTTINTTTETKRTHVPLRMPTKDYSLEVRAAPELAELADLSAHFPPLGRGRGRGLLGSFDHMKM